MTPPLITTRAQLMDALRLAAELEHGLMSQYLFAAYSLKRYPYERFEGPKKKKEILTEAELERVRRWAMKITLIARQEMEHLGLALNLLSAIGGTPSFSRPNMPQRLDYYGEAHIKLELTPCDLDTIKRFQVFEAPKNVNPEQHGAAQRWCERMKGGASPEAVYEAISSSDDRLEGAPHVDLYGVPFKDVQELYEAIDRGFTFVSRSIGECSLFIGRPQNQIYGGPPSPLHGSMNDLNQYGLSLIAVTDLASARQAIRTIVEQGEGIRVPPAYLPHTHFCLFTEIREEMEANRRRLATIGARPVVRNPMTRIQPDVTVPEEVTLITNTDTRAVADLFNQCYEVMLLLLLYLYGDQVKTEDQTNGLMDAAFFPFMTMFVRPLAEILTELPAFEDNDPSTTAGPGFELAGDVVLFPNLEQTWSLFQERIDALVLAFRRITARRALPSPDEARDAIEPVRPRWGWVPKHDPWRALPSQHFEEVIRERRQLWDKVKQEGTTIWPDEVASNAGVGIPFDRRADDPPSLPWLRLYYLRQNMERLASDWQQNWLNVGRSV